MNTKDILIILLPLVSGIASSYATYWLAQKSKRSGNLEAARLHL